MDDENKEIDERRKKIWEYAHARRGRQRRAETGDELWEMAVEYFRWAEANPVEEPMVSISQGVPVEYVQKRPRPLSLEGFFIHSGMGTATWNRMRGDREERYDPEMSLIEAIIRNQRIDMALTNVFNANLVSRIEGLADVSKVDHSSKDHTMSPTTVDWKTIPKDARKEILRQMKEQDDDGPEADGS